MILTDEQLIITKDSLSGLEQAYDELNGVNEILQILERNALLSTINELKEEVNDYEVAKNNQVTMKNSLLVDELRKQLVINRISAGFTQEELANKLNISKSLIIRLEATEYENVSFSFLLKCSNCLGNPIVSLSDIIYGELTEIYNEKTSQKIPLWEQLPIKELVRNNWISAKNATNELKEMIIKSGSLTNVAYHKKTTWNDKKSNQAALFSWETKVLFEAQKIIHQNQLISIDYNHVWIKELVSLSAEPNGPILARDFLLKQGIVLVIEKHLEHTYLDGAALLSEEGFPIIGMTLRHDRIDNFWFVLLHELAHVYLHLFTNKFPVFLDEDVGSKSTDIFEIEANEFARNTLITPDKWVSCVSPVMINERAINIDAKNLKIHPAIIAGRIRFENDDYKVLDNLLGRGKVRKLFGVK